ncbi:MAG TPA: ABC transporter ATP-binding protein [Clostridiales bacterium]|nr:ABC transporter ATP-binding protein [Clostridiales bacterium]
MNVLSIKNLCKSYESFNLNNVSFDIKKGTIMGFIGRNGAGKTTTLKSILNFVHPDSGEILFFGKSFSENEFEIKQKLGFVSGGIDYYSKKKLRTITNVTRRFYKSWDEKAYDEYLKLFKLNDNKNADQLSAGMRVKYSLALALSHNAELLILDEPTSGLDPVSRDDLLDIFLTLCDKGITILFSTHITSDLEKCADTITYIKNGTIIASTDINTFTSKYKLVELTKEQLTDHIKPVLIGYKRSKSGYTAIINTEDSKKINVKCSDADLESIMIHIEKE